MVENGNVTKDYFEEEMGIGKISETHYIHPQNRQEKENKHERINNNRK